MRLSLSSGKKVTIIIILILILDQVLKLWVKTHMYLGQTESIFGGWFQLSFTENTGFAFGWSLGGTWGKLLLSLFRIVFIIILAVFLNRLIKRKMPMGVLVGVAMLIAGAAGNIFDSCFYGLIFDTGTVYSPELGYALPYSGVSQLSCDGYAPFLHGSVVDMIQIHIIDGPLPEWIPIWGGKHLTFFGPIFNIADASISIAIIYLLIFQRKHIGKLLNSKQKS